MTRFAFLILIIVFLPLIVLSQVKTDSSRVHHLPLLDVSADKPISNSMYSFSSYKIFSRKQITQSNMVQITEIISRSPGVYIRDYGGLGGMKTISTRGTSSSQTLVLLDGIPISSAQTGSFDLSNMPISLIESIEHIRGGQSAVSGASALGGVLNITTNISNDKYFNADLKYGSYNEIQGSIATNFSIFDSKFAFNAEYSSTDGDYPFKLRRFGEMLHLSRKNADYRNASISVANHSSINSYRFKNILIARSTNRGTPGAVLQGRLEAARARLGEEELSYMSSLNGVHKKKNLFNANLLLKKNWLRYTDPDMPGFDSFGQSNSFDAFDAAFKAGYTITDSLWQNSFSAGTSVATLNGDMLEPSVEQNVFRLNPFISVNSQYNMRLLLPIQIAASARADFFSDNKPAISPLFAVTLELFDNLQLKSQLSHNFRMPNFNEMFYLNYGTASLLPEKSLNWNLNILYNFPKLFNADISLFFIDTRDQIIAVPKSPVSWSAANIDQVIHKGIELSVSVSIESIYMESIGLNWTYQESINQTIKSEYKGKQLPLTPNEILNGFIVFNFDYFSVSGDFDYSSFRYISPDNSPSRLLPAYITCNISANAPFRFSGNNFLLRFDVKNMFDSEYSIVPNYPMPGRRYLIGLRYTYEKQKN